MKCKGIRYRPNGAPSDGHRPQLACQQGDLQMVGWLLLCIVNCCCVRRRRHHHQSRSLQRIVHTTARHTLQSRHRRDQTRVFCWLPHSDAQPPTPITARVCPNNSESASGSCACVFCVRASWLCLREQQKTEAVVCVCGPGKYAENTNLYVHNTRTHSDFA